jgi:hypothetical protein
MGTFRWLRSLRCDEAAMPPTLLQAPRIPVPVRLGVALRLAAALWLSGCHAPGDTARAPVLSPDLAVASAVHDAGRLQAGSPLQHQFTLRNAGGLDLSIDNLRVACDCSATVSARIIRPGAQAVVDASCETANAAGAFLRTITVYSNDPAQPVTTLTLRANIDAEVTAIPAQLYVGHCRRGQEGAGEAQVVAVPPAAVTAVATRGAVIAAVLADGSQPGTKRVRVTIKPDAPLGPFEESLLVRTTSRQRAEVAIPVVGVVDDGPAS